MVVSYMQEKKSFFEKAKEHENEIILGIKFLSMVGEVISFFTNIVKANGGTSHHVTEIIDNNINSIQSTVRVVNVNKHIRNLPEGWKASAMKIVSASKNGITIETNQTWVDDYSKFIK
jgi:hypothetical protein